LPQPQSHPSRQLLIHAHNHNLAHSHNNYYNKLNLTIINNNIITHCAHPCSCLLICSTLFTSTHPYSTCSPTVIPPQVPKVQAKMTSESRRLAHHYNRVRLSQLKRMLDDSTAIAQQLAHTVSRHPSRVQGDRGRSRREQSARNPRKVKDDMGVKIGVGDLDGKV